MAAVPGWRPAAPGFVAAAVGVGSLGAAATGWAAAARSPELLGQWLADTLLAPKKSALGCAPPASGAGCFTLPSQAARSGFPHTEHRPWPSPCCRLMLGMPARARPFETGHQDDRH